MFRQAQHQFVVVTFCLDTQLTFIGQHAADGIQFLLGCFALIASYCSDCQKDPSDGGDDSGYAGEEGEKVSAVDFVRLISTARIKYGAVHDGPV